MKRSDAAQIAGLATAGPRRARALHDLVERISLGGPQHEDAGGLSGRAEEHVTSRVRLEKARDSEGGLWQGGETLVVPRTVVLAQCFQPLLAHTPD